MSVKELFDLTGRVALITGGSRGLGLAMAHALGEMGAKLAITARKEAEVESAVKELRGAGYAVFGAVSDLSRPETLEPMIAAAEAAHGPIDILVNNAGATWGAPAESHPLDAWKKVVDVNLTGTFLVSQRVGRSMIARKRGRIVNIASVAGLKGSRELRALAYHTTKGGLVNFTRALAAEWGQYGITVNAICPGFIPSKMSRDVLAQMGPQIIAATPLKQLGEDRDLAGLAVLLCSDAARHITGQIVAVDGGLTAV
jgi:NAD(P)-dependent dehydrogenase (short-subunit alcohol dehydrogenase family)